MRWFVATAVFLCFCFLALHPSALATSFNNVLFERGKAELDSAARLNAMKIARFLFDHPEFTVTVTGHASRDEGTSEELFALSRKRAEAVRDFLMEKGLAKDRIQVFFSSALDPVFSDPADEQEQSYNRRVTFAMNVEARAEEATVPQWPVKLFYKNMKDDPDLMNRKADTHLLVDIPPTTSPLRATLELLIQRRLSDTGGGRGLLNEFENPQYAERKAGFRLMDARVEDGTAVLVFKDPNGFTSGGSARVELMRDQIEQTALQFEGVRDVRIEPDELFQP